MGKSRGRSKQRRRQTFRFVSWLYCYHRSEIDRFMKYGSPSERLIELTNKKTKERQG